MKIMIGFLICLAIVAPAPGAIADAASRPPAIVGIWHCSNSMSADAFFTTTYRTDGSGERRFGKTVRMFHYEIRSDYIITHFGGGLTTRERFSIRRNTLEKDPYGYWHEGVWAAYP